MANICQPFNIPWAIQIIRSSHSEKKDEADQILADIDVIDLGQAVVNFQKRMKINTFRNRVPNDE
jgi:hypothetical protein